MSGHSGAFDSKKILLEENEFAFDVQNLAFMVRGSGNDDTVFREICKSALRKWMLRRADNGVREERISMLRKFLET
jgi:hypothetical protein